MNATVGNEITGVALNSLPSLGRDVSTFITLQPGVNPDGSVAGAVVDQSSFMLDGGNNTNDMDGSMQVYTPSYAGDPTGGLIANSNGNFAASGPTGVMPTPADSVEEFKVGTTNQTADFNNSSGMQVSVATKRGTNAWHGTVYEYYLDNNFSGNTWDNNLAGRPCAELSLQSIWRRDRWSDHSQRVSRRKNLPLCQLPGFPLAQLRDNRARGSQRKSAQWNYRSGRNAVRHERT